MGVASRAHGDPHNQLSVAITSPWAAVQCHRDIEGETDQPAGASLLLLEDQEVVHAHANLRPPLAGGPRNTPARKGGEERREEKRGTGTEKEEVERRDAGREDEEVAR